jgi:hypothetical protein
MSEYDDGGRYSIEYVSTILTWFGVSFDVADGHAYILDSFLDIIRRTLYPLVFGRSTGGEDGGMVAGQGRTGGNELLHSARHVIE